MIQPAAPRLWIADIAPARVAAWAARHMPWLSPSEQARLARMRRSDRRAQMLAGHVLLRRLVGAVSGLLAAEVEIVSDGDGRPAVVTPPGWQASLAHSGKWVVALIEAGGSVTPGVDIELRKPQRDIRAIVRAACGIETDSPDQAYQVWAQREAEFKAGEGPADVWVATWDDHALAVCARGVPAAAAIDLDGDGPAHELALEWTSRPRLPAAAWTQ
jgi:4'-phosphopantetheinyl transferase EntD